MKIGYVSQILSICVKSLQEAFIDYIANTIRTTFRVSFVLGIHISQPVVLKEAPLLPCHCLEDVCPGMCSLVTAKGRVSTDIY